MTNMWDLESLVKIKEKLKNTLIDRHIEVNKEDTLSDLVDKVAKIGEDTLVNKLINDELTAYENDKITVISPYAFYSKKSLQKINTPNVTTIGSGAFSYCSIREFVCFQHGVFTGAPVFNGVSNIKKLIVPFFNTLSSYQFIANCSRLEIVDVNWNASLGESAFYGCSVLKTVILRANSLCAMPHSNALGSTPIRLNKYGYIYVPEIIVEQYRIATNWSVMANRIIKIEGTIYEDPYWSKKESAYIYVDSVEYELPKDTTVLQFKNTYQIENMYSDGQIMNDEDVLYDFKDTEITTEVK